MKTSLSSLILLACLGLVGCPAAVIPLQYPTHPQAVPAVARLLSDDPVLAQEAKVEVESLGEGASPELLRAMRWASSEGKIRLLDAATKIGKPPAVIAEIYQQAVRDNDEKVRQSAAFHASRAPSLGKQTGPAIHFLLSDRVPEVKAAAITSLAALGSPELLSDQELLSLIDDPNPLVSATAVSVALSRGDPSFSLPLRRALPRLVTQLQNPKAATRATVISALGQYGSAAAPTVPPLATVAKSDPVAEVRVQAAVALMRIGTPAAKQTARETFTEFASSKNAALKAISDGYLASTEIPVSR